MSSDDKVKSEANLGHAAAKLLLHLLRLGDGKHPSSHLMRGAGITDWRTFSKAREELEKRHYWNHSSGTITYPVAVTGVASTVPVASTPVISTPPVASTPVAITGAPLAPSAASASSLQDTTNLTPAPAPAPAASPTLRALPPISPIAEPTNWRAEAMRADLLPSDGDPHQRTSAFQRRRQAQVEVLQGAWQMLFKQSLTNDAAKNLLALTDNYAEDVFDLMEATKARPQPIEYPLGYIRAALSKRRDEQRRSGDTRAMVAASNTGPVGARPADDEYAPVRDDDYYLKQPTPQTAMWRRQTEKALKAGTLHLLEDD